MYSKVNFSKVMNETLAFFASLVVKGSVAIFTIKIATRREIKIDPLKCDIIAPPGAV